MPEQLVCHQVFRKTAAIEGNERLVLPAAAVMNGLRHKLLAGTAFSGNNHVAVNPCDLVDHFYQLADMGADAKNLPGMILVEQFLPERFIFGYE